MGFVNTSSIPAWIHSRCSSSNAPAVAATIGTRVYAHGHGADAARRFVDGDCDATGSRWHSYESPSPPAPARIVNRATFVMLVVGGVFGVLLILVLGIILPESIDTDELLLPIVIMDGVDDDVVVPLVPSLLLLPLLALTHAILMLPVVPLAPAHVVLTDRLRFAMNDVDDEEAGDGAAN